MYELVGAGEIDVVHIGRSAHVPVAALRIVERQRNRRGSVLKREVRPEPGGNPARASRPPERARRPTP